MSVKKKAVVLLFVSLIIALLSVFLILFEKADIVYAESSSFSGGDGRAESPYRISTANDFCALGEINSKPTLNGYLGVYFVVTKDIDLSGRNLNPIGSYLYPFKGHLDGQGHTIKNVSINSSVDYTGLFGAINSDASLTNITVSGKITGTSNVGGIVGLNQGTIKTCVNLAEVNSTDDISAINVGGICGYNENVISDCRNSGNVHGYGVNTGGIVGTNANGAIRNCFNIGIITSEYYGAGGIAGNNEAAISVCFNMAAVSAYSTAGGIVGSNEEAGVIENTYNSGVVSVTNSIAGGISGGNDGKIYNSYNAANIVALSQKGAICGYISSSAVLDSCFSSSDKFDGKLTFRGNDYPNCKVLKDTDLANVDALTNKDRAFALSSGKGAGVWKKRSYDTTYCYYPELSAFFTTDFSKNSVRLNRETPDVSLSNESYEDNGKDNTPSVYKGDELLVESIDFTIKYANNRNVGQANSASAEITFINCYKGTVTKYFSITPKPISIKWSNQKFFYTGAVQYPTVASVTGAVGSEKITFKYSYNSNIEVGTHTVTVQLDGDNKVNQNYYISDLLTNEYEIFCAALTVEWDTKMLYYNGTAQHPEAKIKDGLKNNDSAKLIFSDYMNNIDAKQGYKVKVTCDNDNYSLNEIHTYGIEKRQISAEFETVDFYYNGKVQYPAISKVNDAVDNEQIDFVYKEYENNISVDSNYIVVAELADTITNSNYFLSETKTIYEIKRQPITVVFDKTTLTYNARPQYPPVYVKSGVVDGEEVILKISDFSSNINATIGEEYSILVSLDLSYDVNKNYDLETVTYNYGIAQAEMYVEWNERSLPLIYNAQVQHPVAVITSEVYDECIDLLYGECDSINVGKDYSIVIESGNKNYKIVNALKYEIEPMPVTVQWKGKSCLVYNGSEQYPEVEIATQVYDSVGLLYGECNNTNVGNSYSIYITCDNENYYLINNLSYSIVPKVLDVLWSDEKIIYNGLAQHPEAFVDGVIGQEQISFIYKEWEDNFDVNIAYSVYIELENENSANNNYLLNLEQVKKSYRIEKKEIELVEIKALDRVYDGKTNVELTNGNLEGVIDNDNVSYQMYGAAMLSASAGKNKSVMYMPSLVGEHAYRYKLIVPEIKVNIFRVKIDSSVLTFSDRTFLFDGETKSLQLQGELPGYVKYEIVGNGKSEVGDYLVTVHFIYNEVNVEPIEDLQAHLYIAASEYFSDDEVKLEILNGNIEYGAKLKNSRIQDIDDTIFPENRKCIRGFNLHFCKDSVEQIQFVGRVKVLVPIDDETLTKDEIRIYGLYDGKLQEIEYKIINSYLEFMSESLNNFYITVEKEKEPEVGNDLEGGKEPEDGNEFDGGNITEDRMWSSTFGLVIGVSGCIAILACVCLAILVIFKKKRKIAINRNITVVESPQTSEIAIDLNEKEIE